MQDAVAAAKRWGRQARQPIARRNSSPFFAASRCFRLARGVAVRYVAPPDFGAGIFLTLVYAASYALAACDVVATPADLAREVISAERAYEGGELDTFAKAITAANAVVPCLDGPLSPAIAAGFHRVAAFSAITRDDAPAAVAELRAVLAVEPQWQISEAIAPPGNPNREAFDAAKIAGLGGSSLAHPPGGVVLYVDGSPVGTLPTERPYLLQAIRSDGRVVGNQAMQVHQTVPTWAVAPRSRPVLAIAAGGFGLGAIGLYGAALAMRAQFDDPTTPFSELDSLESGTNAAVFTSVGLGAVAVGLGTAAVVVKW